MAQIAKRLTPDDVGAVATWLAAQPVPSPAQADASAPGPVPLPCGSTDHPPR
jgi:cytochrome c553